MRRRGARAALGLVVLVTLATACGGDGGGDKEEDAAPSGDAPDAWTQLGHDVRSSFHNPAATLTPEAAADLHTAWTFEAPGTVSGAPAVSGDRAYVLSGSALLALDAASGEEIWRRDDIHGSASPTLADGILYALAGDTTMWAVDPDDGGDRWHVLVDDQQFASGFSSPVVAGDAVLVGLSSVEEVTTNEHASYRGGVVALDRRTGEELWRYQTAEAPNNGVGVWSSVSVDLDAGTVFATTGNNYTDEPGPTSDSIIALDLATGDERWVHQVTEGDVFSMAAPRSTDSDLGTNPILFEAEVDGTERELVGAGQKSGAFWVLDRDTGEEVWHRQVSGGSAIVGGVFNNGGYDGTSIFVVGNNAALGEPIPDPSAAPVHDTSILMALDPATGEIRWQRELAGWVMAPITLGDGVGFVAVDRNLTAFDTETGDELFSIETVGTITSAPALVGDRVYFGSGIDFFVGSPGRTVYALEA